MATVCCCSDTVVTPHLYCLGHLHLNTGMSVLVSQLQLPHSTWQTGIQGILKEWSAKLLACNLKKKKKKTTEVLYCLSHKDLSLSNL